MTPIYCVYINRAAMEGYGSVVNISFGYIPNWMDKEDGRDEKRSRLAPDNMTPARLVLRWWWNIVSIKHMFMYSAYATDSPTKSQVLRREEGDYPFVRLHTSFFPIRPGRGKYPFNFRQPGRVEGELLKRWKFKPNDYLVLPSIRSDDLSVFFFHSNNPNEHMYLCF